MSRRPIRRIVVQPSTQAPSGHTWGIADSVAVPALSASVVSSRAPSPERSAESPTRSAYEYISEVESHGSVYQLDGMDIIDRFWFVDGSVVIKLRNTCYKVHNSVLEAQSPSFCKELAPKAPEGHYHLLPTDILNADFELLLSFVYPTSFGPDFQCSTDEWLRVLVISTRLGFTALRRAALNALAPVYDAVARIRLARAYGVDEWLVGAYHELCKRTEPLDLEEARELGLEDMVRLARARETLLRGGAWAEVEDLFALPDPKNGDITESPQTTKLEFPPC
ncbi:hypothetical protein M0805_004711 [Coniferiporia weirii]|nr:hypothetical protein M0805_004711 [Coniferiporia weirii]